MNTKKLICTLLMLPAGLCMAQDAFKIEGKLSKAATEEQVVVLNYVTPEGKNTNDTTQVKKGSFSFSGNTAFGNRAYLTLMPAKKDTGKVRRQADYQQFYLEKGNYKVTGADSMHKATVTGPQVQSDYLAYEAKMGGLLTQWRDINQRAMKVLKDSVAMKAIQAEARPLHATIEATLDSFIFSHPDSYVTLDLVNDNKTGVIDPETFDKYYTALSPRVMNSFTGKKMTAKYEKAKQTFVGKAFDFSQEDAQGKNFQLASLRGKYVLIDFWASWCAPCRAENPNLVKAYQLLKDKKFEVVGISLDDNKAAWIKAIEKDGLPWIHVSDLKGWKNDVAVKYGVTAVPQNVLINPEGVIIAKNLRGEELTAKLTELIK